MFYKTLMFLIINCDFLFKFQHKIISKKSQYQHFTLRSLIRRQRNFLPFVWQLRVKRKPFWLISFSRKSTKNLLHRRFFQVRNHSNKHVIIHHRSPLSHFFCFHPTQSLLCASHSDSFKFCEKYQRVAQEAFCQCVHVRDVCLTSFRSFVLLRNK